MRPNVTMKPRTVKLIKKTLVVAVATVFVYVASIHQAALAAAQMLGSATDARAREYEDRRGSGYLSPESVQSRMDHQQAVVDYLNRTEQLKDRQGTKLREKISANIDQADFEHKQNAFAMAREAELARKKTFAIFGQKTLFNYILYGDGKKVWLKDGNVMRIENERIVDENGNVSIKNTYNMEYNEKKLMEAYEADITDALGNATHIKWYGGTYTRDSVYYANDATWANKHLTSYTQETTDSLGNTTKIEWSNATYKGKLLLSYRESYLDARGNTTTRDWSGGTYDRNRQLTGFQETTTDALGNVTTRYWSGGTYIRNPAYDQHKETRGEAQDMAKYLLTGYHEEIVDGRGNRTVRDWNGAKYDRHGQLVSYNEVTREANGRVTTTRWSDAGYDRYGRLTSYDETKNINGAETRTLWKAEEYTAQGRCTAYTETQIDAYGNRNTVYRHDLLYNRVGDVLSYNQTSTDRNGNEAQIEWNNSLYDRYGRLLGYHETTTDDQGNHTEKTWGDVVLDRYGQLLGYREENVDPLGNHSTVLWGNVVYNLLGQLTSYRETDTNILGLSTTKVWENAAYDEHNRMQSYRETDTDIYGLSTQKTWTAAGENGEPGYDAFSRLINYKEESTNIYNEVNTLYWTNGLYDARGDLSGYTEVLLNPDGTRSLRTRTDTRYDDHDRVASYVEKYTDPDGAVDTYRFTNAAYDTLGRLSTYREQFGDGAVTERLQTDYNTLHQCVSYQEESRETDATTTDTTWTADAIDGFGRVTDYTRRWANSANPDVMVTTVLSGISLDVLGQQLSGTEVKTTQGRTALGQPVNVTVTKRLENVAVNGRGILAAYDCISMTTGTDPQGTALALEERQSFTNMTATSYRLVIRTVGGGIDHTVITDRTNIRHNKDGIPISYRDETFDEATPGGTTVVERGRTCFNARGEVSAYREVVTDVKGESADRIMSGILYDGFGNMAGYTQLTVRREAGQEDSREHLVRSGIGYDVIGRMVSFKESAKTDGMINETVTEWQANSFNAALLATGYTTVTTIKTPGVFTADQVQRSVKSNVLYNRFGQVIAFDEDGIDTASADLSTHRRVQDITYDDFGQIVAMTDITRTTGEYRQSLPTLEDLNDRMLSGAKLLYAGSEVDWDTLTAEQKLRLLAGETVTVTVSGADISLSIADNSACVVVERFDTTVTTRRELPAFDARHRLVSYRETVTTEGRDPLGVVRVSKTETRTRDNITYDTGKEGRIVSYRETVTSSDSPEMVTVTEMAGIQYDPTGQMHAYTQTVVRKDSATDGATLFVRTVTARSNISYYATNKIKSFTDTVTRSDTPGLTYVTERLQTSYDAQWNEAGYVERTTDSDGYCTETTAENIRYNGLGLETARKETVRTTAATGGVTTLSSVQTTETTYVRYNCLGQKVASVEKQSFGDNGTATILWGGARYNDLGQLESFSQEKKMRSADGLNSWERQERTHTVYNNLGQITQTTELLSSSDAPEVVTTETTSGIGYNRDGYRNVWNIASVAEGHSLSGELTYTMTTITNRTATAFDDRGQVLFYSEHTERNAANGAESFHSANTAVRSGMTYNAAHQLLSYDETATKDGGITIETTWRQGAYDIAGRLTSYVQAETDAGNTTTTARSKTSYTASGRVAGYTETVAKPTGQTVTVARSLCAYDSNGRLAGYTESVNATDQPGVTVTTARGSMVYNGIGLAETWLDAVTTDGVDEHGVQVLLTTVASARLSTQYNVFGLAASSVEETTNSTTGMRSRTGRANMTYDTRGRLLQYRETRRDQALDGSIDTTRTVERTATVYNDRDCVTDYEETQASSATPGIVESISYASHVNDKGQVLDFTRGSFTNRSGAAYDAAVILVRDNITYDALGRELSWHEAESNSTEPDVTVERTRSAISYTNCGQLKSYADNGRRYSTDGSLDVRTATVRTATAYDLAGFERSYQETSTSSAAPDVTVSREWSNGSYRHGLLYGYTETVRRQGSGVDGTLDVTNTTTREWTTYNAGGQVSGQREHSISSAEQAVTSVQELAGITYDDRGNRLTYTEANTRTSSDGSLNSASTTRRTATSYTAGGLLTGYTETTVSSDAPDVTATVNRSNILYNTLGQITSYEEGTTRHAQNLLGLDTLNQVTTVQRSLIAYNASGEMVRYRDAVSTNYEGDSQKTWEALAFNRFGQMTRYRESGATVAQGNYSFDWTGSYNVLGQSAGTTETLATDNAGTSVKTQSGILYNDKGQVRAYSETSAIEGAAGYTTVFNASFPDAYDANGRRNHYRETTTTGGVTTTAERTASGYNGCGQLASYQEQKTEVAAGIVKNISSIDWAGTYNIVGLTDHFSETIATDIYASGATERSYIENSVREWFGTLYDRGLIAAFREVNTATVRTPQGALVQQTGSDYTRSGITCDAAGRVTRYDENGTDTQSGGYAKQWQATGFTSAGKVTGFTETGYTLSGGPNNYTRSGITYDAVGHILSYDDYGIMGGKYARKHWESTSAGYDILGRLLAYTESGWTENGHYTRTQTTAAYDLLGRLVASSEYGENLSDGNYQKTISNTGYDTSGRRSYYEQNLVQSDLGRTTVTTWRTTGSGYNADAQLTGYRESGRVYEGGSAVEDIETVWSALLPDAYTSLGQLARYASTVTRTSLDSAVRQVIVTERHSSDFAADGRLSGYQDTTVTTTSNTADPSQNREERTATTRTGIAYYTAAEESGDARCREGMLARYREFTLSSTASEKPRQVIADKLLYDSATGRLIDSLEVAADEDIEFAALRRLAGWLTLSGASAVITDAWEQAGIELAQLFGTAGLADRIAQWLEDHKTDLSDDAALWPSQLNALRSLMGSLSALLSSPNLAAALTALNDQVQGNVPLLSSFIDKLAGTISFNSTINDLSAWLTLSKNTSAITDEWRTLSITLANLFSDPALTESRVLAWLTANRASLQEIPDELNDPDNPVDPVVRQNQLDALWQAQLNAFAPFVGQLKGLAAATDTAAACDALFAFAQANLSPLSALIRRLSAFAFVSGRLFSVLPDVPYASSALAALKPFDYAATVTHRTNMVYDSCHRLVSWREYAYSSNEREKVTVSDVEVTYEGISSRYATYAARIVETTNVAGDPLSLVAGTDTRVTNVLRYGYVYNALELAQSYTETNFEGDTLTVTTAGTESVIDWRALGRGERLALAGDLLSNAKEVKETVTIKRYSDIRYSATLQVSDYDLITDVRGYAYQQFSEAQEMTGELAQQRAVLAAQLNALNALLSAVEDARKQWADTATGTGAYYDAKNLYEAAKAGCADPVALAKYFSADFPAATEVEAVKAVLNNALSYYVEKEADREVKLNADQEVLRQKLAAFNVAKQALDAAIEAYNAADNAWRSPDPSKPGCLTSANSLIEGMKAVLLAAQNGTTKLLDDTDKLKQLNVRRVTDATERQAIETLFNEGSANIGSVLAGWTLPAADAEMPVAAIDDLVSKALVLKTGLAQMLEGTTRLAAVIDSRSNIINGVTGDLLQTRNTTEASMQQAWADYEKEYVTLFGTNATDKEKQDFSAPAAAGGLFKTLLDTKNAAENTPYTYGDPFGDLSAAEEGNLITAVAKLGQVYAQTSNQKNTASNTVTACDSYLGSKVGTVWTVDLGLIWFDIRMIRNGSDYAFQWWILDDFERNLTPAEVLEFCDDFGGSGTARTCVSELSALRANRALVDSLTAKMQQMGDGTSTPGFYTTARKKLNELTAAYTAAKTAYDTQWGATEKKYNAYITAKTAYETAQKDYDNARAELAAVSAQKAGFSSWYQSAADDHARMVPAAATLKAAIADKAEKQRLFTEAETALGLARAAFNASMKNLTDVSAEKETAEGRVGGLLDALSGLERVQQDLACEQGTRGQIAADETTLEQRIATQLQNREYLVGGAVHTVSAAQAAQLAAGGSIAFAGQTLDLDGLLAKLSVDAKLKISASQTTTTARRNMTYDPLGNLKTYDELSFTGTEIIWNGASVAWSSLSSTLKDSVFGSTPPTIALTGDGSLSITRGRDHAYDREGKLVKSVVSTRETRRREGSADTYTREYTVTTDGIEYAGSGNITRYRRTTVDGQKTTVETTLDDLRYNLKDQLVESNLAIAETARLADGTVVYKKNREVRTSAIVYNDLGHMTGFLRVTDDNGKFTVEKTIGDAAYNRQGQLVYSHNRVVETDAAHLAVALSEIGTGKATVGKVTEVITRGAEYDSRDMLTKLVRTTIEIDISALDAANRVNKRTDEEITMTYDAGRLKTSVSAVRESAATPTGGLFYRSYGISLEVTSFYHDTELAASQTRVTTEGTKVTAETSTGMAYDSSGRLTHSLVAVQDSYAGAAATPYTVETFIHDYDAGNNVSHQTKITRENGKTTTETNWDQAAGHELYAGMAYENGNLVSRKVLITEKGETAGGAVVYEKSYEQTDSSLQYDSLGQLLKSTKTTVTRDAATGNWTTVEETTTNSYNIRGHIQESSVVTKKYDNDAAANAKVTTQVTRINPSGYNSSMQMENYTTVSFDSDRVQIDRLNAGSPERVKLLWTELTEIEKRNLINGRYKDAHDDIVAVTFMNNVRYQASLMTDWIATTRTLGPITVGLQTLLASTFKGVDLAPMDEEEKLALFDSTIGKGTILLDPAHTDVIENVVQAASLTRAEKLAVMEALEHGDPITLRSKPLLDAKNNELVKIRVPLDSTSVTVRRDTSYDGWGRLTGYDEISLEGRGIFLNGVFHTWNSLSAAQQDAIIAAWDRCVGERPESVARSEVNFLPNNFVTRTKMSGMTYTGKSELQGYTTSKHELQLSFADVRANLASATVPLAVNRVSHSSRSESVKNALGQEIAVKETSINPDRSGSISWTFYLYEDGKAKELLKISEAVYENELGEVTESGQWTMEHTYVDSYTNLANTDLFEKIHTVTTRGIAVTDTLKNSTLSNFVNNICLGKMSQFESQSHTLLPTAITETDEMTFEYVYDKISNAPVVSRTTRLHKDVENIKTLEDTFYYYVKSDTKPSHVRTITINDPVLDAGGKWTGIETQEDSVLEYNTSGLVKRTSAVKKDAAGICTYETVDYTYSETGQVGKTVKNITQDVAGNFSVKENGVRSQVEETLPLNFLFYDAGGVTFTETTAFTYYDDSKVRTMNVVRTGLAGEKSAEHVRYYYNPLTARLDSSITVSLEGTNNAAALAGIAALSDADIADAQKAVQTLQLTGFAWDYTRRSDIAYNAKAFLAGYTEHRVSCEAPEKESVITASGMDYDAYGRMTGRTTENVERRLSDGVVIGMTRTVFTAGRTGDTLPAYDALGRLWSYTEVTVQDSDHNEKFESDTDRMVTELVRQSFSSADGRVISSERDITETGRSGSVVLNHHYKQTATVTAYDGTLGGLPAREVTTVTDGNRITTDESTLTYDAATRRVLKRETATRVLETGGSLDSASSAVMEYAGYNGMGLATGYTVTSTQNGKTTVQTVSGIDYDLHGQVNGQMESFVETIGAMPAYRRAWTVAVDGQTWNTLGLLASAHRITVDRGISTEETLSGYTYDSSGRCTGNTAATFETDTATGGTALYRHSEVTTVNAYDARGLVTASARTTTEYGPKDGSAGGPEIVVKRISESSTLEYDAQERVAVSTTETTEMDAGTTPGSSHDDRYRVRTENTYALDTGLIERMTRVREDNFAAEKYHLKTTEEIDGIGYDEYGRMLSSTSRFTETNPIAGDGTLNRSYQVTTSNAYDNLGRVEDYTRTTVEGLRTTVEDVTASLTYSRRGELLQSALHTMVSSLDGIANSVTDVTTVYAGFDAWGRATGYTRTTLEGNTRTVETTTSIVYLPSGKISSSDSSFRKTDTATGGSNYDRVWKEKTTGMGYNVLGFNTSYTKTTEENGRTTVETMTAASYDSDGRLSGSTISYTETGAGTSYTYTDTVPEPDVETTYTTPALNHTWTATTAGIDYYASGEMRYYEKTVADDAKQTIEKTILSYADGRVSATDAGYTETADGTSLNHTYAVRTTNDRYDDYGRIIDYTRTTIDGSTTVDTVTGQTYNLDSQVLRYTKVSVSGEKKTTETCLADIGYDALGRAFYTKLDRLEEDATGAGRLSSRSEITNLNLQFDEKGRVVQYCSTTIDRNSGIDSTVVCKTNEDMRYTTAGQLEAVSYRRTETGTYVDGAGKGWPLSLETTVRIDYGAYASNGQAGNMVRTTTDGVRRTIEAISMAYDPCTNLMSSSVTTTRETQSDGGTGVLDVTSTVSLNGIAYDALGRISGMTRSTVTSDDGVGGSKTVTEMVTSQTYDGYGRFLSSVANVHEFSAGTLNHTYRQEVTVDAFNGYNSLNQVVNRTFRTSLDSGAPDRVTIMTQHDMRYDTQGRLYSYKQESTNNASSAMNLYAERLWTNYNGYGQVTTYEENTWRLTAAVQELDKLLDGILADGNPELLESNISLAGYVDSLGNQIQNISIASILSRLDDTALYTDGSTPLAKMTLSQIFSGIVRQGLVSAGVSADSIDSAVQAVITQLGDMPVRNNMGETESLAGMTLPELLCFMIGNGWGSYMATITSGSDTSTTPLANMNLSAVINPAVDPDTLAIPTITVNGTAVRDMTLREAINGILTAVFKARGLTDAEVAALLAALSYHVPGKNASGAYVDLLDTAIKDIADPKITGQSFREIIKTYVFLAGNGANAGEIYTRAMKNDIQNLTLVLKDETPVIGGTGMAALLLKGLAGSGGTLQARIIGILKATFNTASYQNDTKVVYHVTGSQYDTRGRLVKTTETRSWKAIGGGGIPGMDTGWRNGDVTVTMTRAYDDATDQLSGQSYYVTGSAKNADGHLDPGNDGEAISYGYMQNGIKYDVHGRETESWSVTAQKEKFDYVWLDANWLGRLLDLCWEPETEEDKVGLIATVTHTKLESFDSLGRVVSSSSEFRRDDGNRTRGSESVMNTTYNPDGSRKSSLSISNSEMRRIKKESNYEDAGSGDLAEAWLTSTNWYIRAVSEIKNKYDDLYVDENCCGAGASSDNRYVYDPYGNIDNDATKNASSKEEWTTFDHGTGMTWYGWVLIAVILVASVAVSFVPGAGVVTAMVSAAISTFLVASLQGASVENALLQAAVAAAVAGVGSYIGKGVKFSEKAGKWLAIKATTKVISFGATTGVNAAMGGNLPFSGTETSRPQSMSSVMTAAKVSMVIAMNVGAAAGEGANSGKMLLLAASAATGSLLGTNGTSRQSGRQSMSRALAGAAREFMATLARAVVMKLTEDDSSDESALAMGSALVALSVSMGSRVMSNAGQQKSRSGNESSGQASVRKLENPGGQAAGNAVDSRPLAGAPQTAMQAFAAAGAEMSAPQAAQNTAGQSGSVTEQFVSLISQATGAAVDMLFNAGNQSSSSAAVQGGGDTFTKDAENIQQDNANSRSNDGATGSDTKYDTSHLATGTAEKESSGVMYFGDRDKAGGAGDYNDKKSILESIGIKVDGNILEGFFGAKAIADMKELLGAQKIDFDTVLGAKVNGKEMALFFKDDMLVAAGMVSASGQKEMRTFSFKLDEEGKVSVASGKIFREIAGKYVEVGSFEYAAKGSKEYIAAMARADTMIQSGEALAKVKQADAVYTETDTAGNMTRRVYLKTDASGNAVVLAAELKAGNGKFKLLTYDQGIQSSGKDGLLAKGKIYEQETNGKYGKEAAGSFEIREMMGTANLSINKSIAQVLSLGANSRIVYKEQMKSGAMREISMNKETGQLEYVYSKDANGNAQVIAFGNVKNQTVNGVQVTNFNSLSKEQQNDVLASLPVMDNRDPATITAKLVAMQNELLKARLQKLAAERGWKLDTEKGQIFMKIPGGEGIQVMRMGEDREGELVIEGRMLQARGDGAGFVPSGPEVLMAPAHSAFARDILGAIVGREKARFSADIGTISASKGLSLAAIVNGKTTRVLLVDASERVLFTSEVDSAVLRKAVDNLKSQQEESAKKGISARVMGIVRKAPQFLKDFFGGKMTGN